MFGAEWWSGFAAGAGVSALGGLVLIAFVFRAACRAMGPKLW